MSDIFFGYYKSATVPERKSVPVLMGNAWANLRHYGIIPRSLFAGFYLLILFVIGFFGFGPQEILDRPPG